MAIFTRRDILRQGAAAPLVAGTGLATALTAFGASAAVDTSGYKALVCVFLRGGMDAHDVLIPYDQPTYDQYAAARASLLPTYGTLRNRDQLLPLTGTQSALPPEMPEIRDLYDAGDLAIVSNVGPLIAPTNLNSFLDGSVPLPRSLFSHNDQQATWSSFQPEGGQFGWGGLFGDAVIAAGANNLPSFTAMSVAGNDVFLSGDVTRQYQLRANGGVQTIPELTTPSLLGSASGNPAAQDLMRDHLAAAGFASDNLFETDIASANKSAVENNAAYQAAFASAPSVPAFAGGQLGGQLNTIARTIGIRSALGARRQIFFASIGGFDTHSAQSGTLPTLLTRVSQAISSFHQAMVDFGLSNDVTLFTASDFGRTLAANGDGTDHGWGGHHFVVGGAVNGGQIYGAVPPPEFDHQQGVIGGRLIPVTSVDQYAATLGSWFGLGDPELNAALPNLSSFSGRPAFL